MEATFDPMLGYVKPHPYYKDIQASSLGMVRIFDHVRKEFVWTYGNRDEKRGRLIWASGHSCLRICRLVAETFIPNSGRLPLVIHKDNDPSNNCVDNLFWGDYRDMQYNSKKNKPTYEKLGVNPYDRKAARKAQYKIWKSNHPRLQFAGHVWHHVTQEEFNLLRPIPWKERPLPERYRK